MVNEIIPRFDGGLSTNEEGLILQLYPETAGNKSARMTNVEVRKVSDTPLHPLGSVARYGDKEFRYVGYGGTILAGRTVRRSVVAVSDLTNKAMVNSEYLAGETIITLKGSGSGSDDAGGNEYAGGYLNVNDSNGEGFAYRILANESLDISNTSATAKFRLEEPLVKALTTASDVTLVKPPYVTLITTDTGIDDFVVGVAAADAASGKFGWVQIKGPCSTKVSGTLVAGNGVVNGTAAGAVGPATGELAVIGRVMVINANTEHALIWLNMD